jgi:ATP-dependent Clp protease ATP-binding subunit ClpA
VASPRRAASPLAERSDSLFGYVKLTPCAREALNAAARIARHRPGDEGVAALGLLVGLSIAQGGFAGRLLGVGSSGPPTAADPRSFRQSDQVSPVLEPLASRASRVAEAMNHGVVGTEHLLLALLEGPSPIAVTLQELGLTAAVVRRELGLEPVGG